MHHLHHRLRGRPSPDNRHSRPRVCTIYTTKLDTHPIADDLAQERAPSTPPISTLAPTTTIENRSVHHWHLHH
eukprot:2617115-Rhodomonas_salina.1